MKRVDEIFSPGNVWIPTGGDLKGYQVVRGEAEDDPADEADVGEKVGQVPQVGNVFSNPHLPYQLDVLPQQANLPRAVKYLKTNFSRLLLHLPEDDDRLRVGGKGAPLGPVPLQCQVVQVVIVQQRGHDLTYQIFDPLARHGQQHQEEDVAGGVADKLDERIFDELSGGGAWGQHVHDAVVGVHHAQPKYNERLEKPAGNIDRCEEGVRNLYNSVI